MLLLQNILYCLLFILMVKCLVRNDGMNCVYFCLLYTSDAADEL